jgi:hypothetical protein
MTVKVVTDQKFAPLFCKWLNERIPNSSFDPKDTTTFGNVDFSDLSKPNVLMVAAFHNNTRFTTQVSTASNGEKRQKISNDFLFAIFHWAFVQYNRTAVYSSIDEENVLSINLCEKLGFTRTGYLPECNGEGKKAFTYALTRKEWLEQPYAKGPAEPINEENNMGKVR